MRGFVSTSCQKQRQMTQHIQIRSNPNREVHLCLMSKIRDKYEIPTISPKGGKMRFRSSRMWLILLLVVLALPATISAQSLRSSLSGTVLDPSGAAVPDVDLTLTSVDRGTTSTAKSGPDGNYRFPNLTAGRYELKVVAAGFKEVVQRGIEVSLSADQRVDVRLEVGASAQTVEVLADVSTLNYENATQQSGIAPTTLAQLPLLVSGGPRSSATFAILMPGVNTGATKSTYDARVNGGLVSGDEAIMDGITMQEGYLSQNGMVSIFQDYPLTPDMVSELKVLTANYEPQYGTTLSSVIIAATKSGSSEYHVGGYEYHRNTVLNARPFSADTRPKRS